MLSDGKGPLATKPTSQGALRPDVGLSWASLDVRILDPIGVNTYSDPPRRCNLPGQASDTKRWRRADVVSSYP